MGESLVKRIGLLAAFLAAVLLTAGCSGDEDSSAERGSTDFPARTLSSPGLETTSAAPPPGTTGSGSSEVVLRLEGDAGTDFSGVCTAGAEDNVLVGQVPKSYSFDLQGQALSCQIKKRGPGSSSLRTILLAGDSTRSVQQTKSQDSTINISYSGG